MKYGMRIGNEGSAEGYVSGLEKNKGEVVQTYGTTTLLNKHVSFVDNKIKLHFLGKEQVEHDIVVTEPFFYRYGKHYYGLGGPDDKWLGIEYDLLFDFVKTNIGDGFIPKDLRTFCGNVTGWNAILSYLDKPKQEKKSDAKKEIKEVVEKVANRLGNTPGIAKRAYIDGRMLDWFLSQRFEESED
jgi:DNA topoisomerase-1